MSTLHQVSVDLPPDILTKDQLDDDGWAQADPRYCMRAGKRLLDRFARRRKAFGASPEVRKLCEITVIGLNMLACRALRQADQPIVAQPLKVTLIDDALRMLQQAGEICGGRDSAGVQNTERSESDSAGLHVEEHFNRTDELFEEPQQRLLMQTTTLNNCACVLRKCGDLPGALRCLEAALQLENTIMAKYPDALKQNKKPANPDTDVKLAEVDATGRHTSLMTKPPTHNPAGTHLNMCAILSKLKRHEEALEHAQSAIMLINLGKSPSSASDGAGNLTSVKAIAHYNLAVEQESLGHLKMSAASYRTSVTIAESDLGTEHTLTKSITQNAQAGLKSLTRRANSRTSRGGNKSLGRSRRRRRSREGSTKTAIELESTSSRTKKNTTQRLRQRPASAHASRNSEASTARHSSTKKRNTSANGRHSRIKKKRPQSAKSVSSKIWSRQQESSALQNVKQHREGVEVFTLQKVPPPPTIQSIASPLPPVHSSKDDDHDYNTIEGPSSAEGLLKMDSNIWGSYVFPPRIMQAGEKENSCENTTSVNGMHNDLVHDYSRMSELKKSRRDRWMVHSTQNSSPEDGKLVEPENQVLYRHKAVQKAQKRNSAESNATFRSGSGRMRQKKSRRPQSAVSRRRPLLDIKNSKISEKGTHTGSTRRKNRPASATRKIRTGSRSGLPLMTNFESFLGDRSAFSKRAPKIPNPLTGDLSKRLYPNAKRQNDHDDGNRSEIEITSSRSTSSRDSAVSSYASYNDNSNSFSNSLDQMKLNDVPTSEKQDACTLPHTLAVSIPGTRRKYYKESVSQRVSKTSAFCSNGSAKAMPMPPPVQISNIKSGQKPKTTRQRVPEARTNKSKGLGMVKAVTSEVSTLPSKELGYQGNKYKEDSLRAHIYWARNYKASVQIQSMFRGHLSRKRNLVEAGKQMKLQHENRKHKAATLIQTAVRKHQARKTIIKRQKSITQLQRAWQSKVMKLAASEFSLEMKRVSHRNIQKDAKLQTHKKKSRLYMFLKKKEKKSRQEKSSGHTCEALHSNQERSIFSKKWNSATKIVQKILENRRRKVELKKEKKKKEEEMKYERAASRIALWYRRTMFIKRCKMRAFRACYRRNQASVTIQMFMIWYAKVLPSCKTRYDSHMREIKSAIFVQSCIRGWILRARLVRLNAARLSRAANVLQRAFRCYKARKQFLEMKHTQHLFYSLSALKLQSAMRGYLGRKLAFQAKEKLSEQIALQVQQDILNAQKEGACLSFQTYVWRPYRARALLEVKRKEKNIQLARQRTQCAIIIQSCFRSYSAKLLARRLSHQKMLRVMNYSAVRIQSCCKGYLVRVGRQRRNSALIIQKNVRGKAQRSTFMNMMHAIILLQTTMRRYIAKKEMLLRRKIEGLDHSERDKLEDGALACLSPMSMDPCVTLRAFSTSGMNLAYEVMQAVHQAENYAAQIERELMGIDGGHVEDFSDDSEGMSGEEEPHRHQAEQNLNLSTHKFPIASSLQKLIHVSGLSQ